jgi:hypothetical protein
LKLPASTLFLSVLLGNRLQDLGVYREQVDLYKVVGREFACSDGAVTTVVDLALVSHSTKSLQQLCQGCIKGRKLISRMGLHSNDLATTKDRKLDFVLWSGHPRVIVARNANLELIGFVD